MKVKLEHRFSFYPDQGIDQLARVSLFQFYCIQQFSLLMLTCLPVGFSNSDCHYDQPQCTPLTA